MSGREVFAKPSKNQKSNGQVSDRGDQLPDFERDSRPSSRLRFPLPKQPQALPMPADEGVGLNQGQSLSPANSLESNARLNLVTRFARRGSTLRYRWKANCLRRKRFSAARGTLRFQAGADEPQASSNRSNTVSSRWAETPSGHHTELRDHARHILIACAFDLPRKTFGDEG